LSETDEELLSGLIGRFRSTQKEVKNGKESASTEDCNVDENTTSWTILELLSKRLRRKPDEMMEAALLGTPFLLLNFLSNSIYTADNNVRTDFDKNIYRTVYFECIFL
jgi:hypothetical protein